jgi:hypothetical protein
VRERLGRATAAPVESAGAYQQFQNGRMFWNGHLDRIFVLYDYWRHDGGGRPSTRIQEWTSYADTFGG